jgi:citrate lyase subunit beta / citryl-CoA lyase
MRSRRSCLSVPGSSPRMLAKAPTLPADEVFMDLEDSVAPQAKEAARGNVRRALDEGAWGGKTVGVRINGVATRWCYRDVIDVVEPGPGLVDVLVIPKVEQAADVVFVDRLLSMVEESALAEGRQAGASPKRVGLEAQIESAAGLRNIHDIAHASARLEALVFGPADMSASLGLPAVTGGLPMPGYPGDHWHWVLETILVAAREAGLDAVDGPYLRIEDLDGFRASAVRARALGYDGKWALHPAQIDVLNDVFTPTQDEFDRASAVVEAYEHAVSVEGRGAVMFGKEMIDEASRRMADRLAARGRAAGLTPSRTWSDFKAEWESTA